MSTDLKSRSKAYNLTRVGLRGAGNVGIYVGMGWGRASMTFGVDDIQRLFASGDWNEVQNTLNLLDETMDLLRADLAQFSLTKGDGMEAPYAEYTAETYCVVTSGETGWSVKFGDDTVCDVYAGEEMARRIAAALNKD